jgi:hypothetical protein
MQVKLPNFLIVGAQRSGTTSLYHYLKQHPKVFMPSLKEPRFFAFSIFKNINPSDPYSEPLRKNSIFTFEEYIKLFEDVKKEKAVGEASAEYLYYYDIVISQIKKFLGDIKIIIILRNPVDRAFSAYTLMLRDQLFQVVSFEKAQVLSFEKYLELEDQRRNENWAPINFLQDLGFYYKQVKAYRENFNEVIVVLYDDLTKDALGLVKDIYDFLEVEVSFVPNVSTRHYVSGVPRSRAFHDLVMKPNVIRNMVRPVVRIMLPKEKRAKLLKDLRVKNLVKPEMKPETREYLKTVYRKDILKLQDLINRDLSHWLN